MKNIDLCKAVRLSWMGSGLSGRGGLWRSGAIAASWIASLLWMLSWDMARCSAIALVLGILVRMFLHTGLFAIAHDAMHDNVLPNQPEKNRRVGRLALGLYGLFSYDTFRELHWRHHCFPAQARDPDYHNDSGEGSVWNAVCWYCRFVATYLNAWQIVLIGTGISLLAPVLVFGIGVSPLNILLFWVLPWCLSSIQLFVFGTYLPHRMSDGSNIPHAAQSFYLPEFWSLLACYHFGYHWEHHAYPDIPWYRLPQVVRGAPTTDGGFLSAIEAI
ncbi:MAG: fatty acid desaturase [Synechococcus sp.]